MKKILLASTALVLSAGVAAAQTDIRFGGLARFGILYDSGRPDVGTVDDRWVFVNRFRLQVDATRTTDTGLTFGARMRFQADNTAAGFQGNAVRFFARAEGLEVAFGNIFGVIDSLPNLYMPGVPSAGVGLIGNGFHNVAANTVSNGGVFGWTAYASGAAPLGIGSNGVEATYTFGGFTIHGLASLLPR
jgi:outer membrane protein OmpU